MLAAASEEKNVAVQPTAHINGATSEPVTIEVAVSNHLPTVQSSTSATDSAPNGSVVLHNHASPAPTAVRPTNSNIPPTAQAGVSATKPAFMIDSSDNNNNNNNNNNIMVRARETVPISTRGRGRGGASRARGKSRAAAKGRKRKRDDDGSNNDDDEELSEDSEICAPTAVMTKSGRSVQRPTAFVPPPAPSPTSTPVVKKKKRVWRKNPENAVCKLCLRGVSPASNMIVFCDGCNTPYHRWCHHPPIDQSVIDETDKEWYCRQCRRERIVPVPEADITHFVAAGNAPAAERQRFFAGLTPGALVTLLTRMSTLYPDLPAFDPDFALKHANGEYTTQKQAVQQPSLATQQQPSAQPSTIYINHDDDDDEDDGYGPDEHPAHYVRPGRGLMSTLPPDKDDEQHLVDEDSSKGVFHHIYLVDAEAARKSVSSGPS